MIYRASSFFSSADVFCILTEQTFEKVSFLLFERLPYKVWHFSRWVVHDKNVKLSLYAKYKTEETWIVEIQNKK